MQFRLVTYNIHKGIGGVDRRYRLQRIVEVLQRYEPDIALLQEVTEGMPRSRRQCQVELIGDALGLEHRAYQRNVRLTEGHYGNATLSRFPLSQVHDIDLSLPLKKRRQALSAVCRLPTRKASSLLVVNCHLGLAESERARQVQLMLTSTSVSSTDERQPVIVAGDYNDVWYTLGRQWMEPAGFQCASGHARTFPAILPVRSLDRIFYRGDIERIRGFASRSAISRQASDHLPVVADFELAA